MDKKWCKYCRKERAGFIGKRCDTCNEAVKDPTLQERRNHKIRSGHNLGGYIQSFLDKKGAD